MLHLQFSRSRFFRLTVAALASLIPSVHAVAAGLPSAVLEGRGVTGGLCVHIGSSALDSAIEMARGGRFLVQIFEADSKKGGAAIVRLRREGIYGLVSVDPWDGRRLPLAENLANVLVVCDPPTTGLMTEAVRVMRPDGLFIGRPGALPPEAIRSAGLEPLTDSDEAWRVAHKPWPAQMDQWTHPRHAADGNPVSRDNLVSPPRQVRWIQHAVHENSRMVTDAGRCFYSDILARDAFNGLRLWAEPIPSATSGPTPVAAGDRLFARVGSKLVALNAGNGELVLEYTEAGTPNEFAYFEGHLLTTDTQSVRLLDAVTGRLVWRRDASEPFGAVAGDGAVYLLEGSVRRGEQRAVVCLDVDSGAVRWRHDDLPWADKVRRCVYHRGLVAYEVSTLNNDEPGNVLYIVDSRDGRLLWNREFAPGMNHAKQARAMFVDDLLWILEKKQCVALDPRSGQEQRTFPAGYCHCFPPVATPRYLLAGEMELTDLATGHLDAQRITKAACGRDAGWVPANGLIYVFPKHCVCWPMLRGYAALAPSLTDGEADKPTDELRFPLEHGRAAPSDTQSNTSNAWPCYRQNPFRSGSTPHRLPDRLVEAWSVELGDWPSGPIADDWRENPFVRGPVTAPVIAGGRVIVARPDAHEVLALRLRDGKVLWRVTVSGRVDTAPTLYDGLCLFGTKSGWVYCLRADDGAMVWRLRAAPAGEQIVAYGQLESPWPVPGSVLVVDDVAYFAAGRQSLAEGGILVFAVEPRSGAVRWVRRIDSVPQTSFYASNALEFDNFDLLFREGDQVAMSRWVFERTGGRMTCKDKEAFVLLDTGRGGVAVPRGCWSYAPRNQQRHGGHHPTRAPLVFRENVLLGCTEDRRSVFRRDFDLPGEKFDLTWLTGWAASTNYRNKTAEVWQSDRLGRNARWSSPLFDKSQPHQSVAAMLLAGDRLYVAGAEGGLAVVAIEDGNVVQRNEMAPAIWDGMAAAEDRLLVTTRDGALLCLKGEGSR